MSKQKKEDKPELKSLKITESVHTKLKVHVAKKKLNITSFVDAAILEKLKSENK